MRGGGLAAFCRSIARSIATSSSTRYYSYSDTAEAVALSKIKDAHYTNPSRKLRARMKRLLEMELEASGSSLEALKGDLQIEGIMRNKVRELLENARSSGKPFPEALQAYDEPFTVVGFQRALTGIDPDFAIPVYHWGKTQVGFSFRPRLVYCVMGALRRGDKLETDGRRFIEELKDDPEAYMIAHSALYFNHMYCGEAEKAEKFADEVMKPRGVEFHSSLFGRLQDLRCIKAGLDASVELYKEHMAKNWVADADGLITLITRLSATERAMEAYEIFVETGEKGVVHHENIHQSLIAGLARINKLDEAFKVAECMIAKGTKSLSSPLKMLIQKLVGARKYDEAFFVLKDLVRVTGSAKGVRLVRALSLDNKLDFALEVLKEIESIEVGDMRDLIIHLCKANRVEDARAVFDKMIAAGGQADAQVCVALAKCSQDAKSSSGKKKKTSSGKNKKPSSGKKKKLSSGESTGATTGEVTSEASGTLSGETISEISETNGETTGETTGTNAGEANTSNDDDAEVGSTS